MPKTCEFILECSATTHPTILHWLCWHGKSKIMMMWIFFLTTSYIVIMTTADATNHKEFAIIEFERCNHESVWHWSCPWWRHQMETFSALLAIYAGNSPVPGEFPTQRPLPRSFDVSFDLRRNKRLNKKSWGWWFDTLLRPLWRQCNVKSADYSYYSRYLPRHVALFIRSNVWAFYSLFNDNFQDVIAIAKQNTDV